MSVWTDKSENFAPRVGVLFQRQRRSRLFGSLPAAEIAAAASEGNTEHRKHRWAFAGLYLVMLLVYFRPQEVLPDVFGEAPLVKVATIVTIVLYLFSKVAASERIVSWPLEMKMIVLMWTLGVLFWPIAVSPQDSFNVLFDPFIKTIIVFIMLLGLVDTRQRLRRLFAIMVFCQVMYALSAIKTFMEGGYSEAASFHKRIEGWGVSYANPNDLASVLNLILPFAVCFGLTRRKLARPVYFAFAALSVVGVFITFSRSGFIGLVIVSAFLVWKLSRGYRVRVLLGAVAVSAVLVAAMPGKYVARLSTIVNPEADATNSAQERRKLLERAAEVAVKRSIVGIGVGNFHIFSVNERVAHNSFLETAAELSVVGLIAYLVLIFAPFRSLQRIERETRKDGTAPDWEAYIISICLQASMVAYIVYGFFGSVQYLNFLYFGAAYIVAFRQIYTAEQEKKAIAKAVASASTSLTRGVLWQPRQTERLQLTSGSR
jgi:hypothetical protein